MEDEMEVPNYVPKADFVQLKAQLEDTQASLAAACARIEASRQREKVMAQELAKLRLGQAGAAAAAAAAAAGSTGAASPERSASPAQPRPAPPGVTVIPPGGSSEPDAAAASAAPTYITEIDGHLPLVLLQGSKKVPASAVLTPGCLDLVEVRARIRAPEFVGFASAPASRRSAAQQLLPACLNPAAVEMGMERSGELGSAPSSPGGGGNGERGGLFSPSAPSSPGAAAAAARAVGLSSRSGRRLSWNSGAGASPGRERGGGGGNSPRGSPKASWSGGVTALDLGGASSSGSGSSATGAWQILWRADGGLPRSIVFEATQETREALHRHTARWQDGGGGGDADDDAARADAGAVVEPRLLTFVPAVGALRTAAPRLSEPSAIASEQQLTALASALPARFGSRPWSLLYSTKRHGTSLATLLRRASGCSPTALLVRDHGGHVFGAFALDPWRVAPRFYGTGETFVFTLAPHMLAWPWKTKSAVKNDFFTYVTPDCLAVGGLGHFALWLDADLLSGNSDACGTFGSPCLAVKEEFRVAAVELWHLG